MRACIIACGQSSRLAPFTRDRPKALIPYGERTVLAHQLDTLHRWGIDQVTVLHRDDHHPAPILEAIKAGGWPRVELAAAPANWPGVFDRLRHHYGNTDGPVMTLNCDLLVDHGWGDILTEHTRSGAVLTLAATAPPAANSEEDEEGQYGRPRVLTLQPGGTLAATRPPGTPPPTGDSRAEEVIAHQIGISVISPGAWTQLADLPHRAGDPWADEFVPALISAGHPVRIATRAAPWRDVGTWYRLWLAHRALTRPALAHQFIHPTARIGAGAHLDGWIYVGANTHIDAGATVIDSAVLAGAYLGPGTVLDGGLALPGTQLCGEQTFRGTVHPAGAPAQPMPRSPNT